MNSSKLLNIRLLPANLIVVGGLMVMVTVFFLFPAHAKALDSSDGGSGDSSTSCSADDSSSDGCDSSSTSGDSDSSDSADTGTTDQSGDGTSSSSTDTSAATGSDQSDSTGSVSDGSSGDSSSTDPSTTGTDDSSGTDGSDQSTDPSSSDQDNDTCPTDDGSSTDSGTTDTGTGDDSSDTSGTTGPSTTGDQDSDSSTDPSSTTTPTDQGSDDGSDTTDLSANNCDDSTATSGGATVTQNQDGGNATTGNASDVLNLINELSAITGLSPAQLSTFVINIMGDQTGNVQITPAMIEAGLNSAYNSGDPSSGNTVINTDGSIDNNDNLSAQTGDADVSDNGVGGDAISGNADVVANIINIINSIIADQQAFIGTVNIYGNLDGDILLPQQLVDDILSLPGATSASGAISSSDTQNIVNNITESAGTGDATVSDNGSAGSATSGNASNNVQLSNLVGYQLTGSNMLLVIINVMGSWYGVILNGAGGTDTALLGNGDSSTSNTQFPDTAINSITNESIVNNVNLSAESGNATVENNWLGGNATSGNAATMANIINFADDEFNLSGWFGILFINVFGTWSGNLSTYNDAPPVVDSSANLNPSGPSVNANPVSYITKVYYYWTPGFDGSTTTSSPVNSSIVAASTEKLASSTESVKPGNLNPVKGGINLALVILVLIPGLGFITLERVMAHRQKTVKNNLR